MIRAADESDFVVVNLKGGEIGAPMTTSRARRVVCALAKDRPAGISRTEVRDLFSRNKKTREIDRALNTLVDAGRRCRTTSSDGRGRPAEVWVPVAA